MKNEQNDATVNLIEALIENMKGAAADWEQLSMVIYLDKGELRGTYGYAYLPDGTISAVASRPSAIEASVQAYLTSYFEPGDALPLKLLVQFDRTLGEYEVTFEDNDASRWKVSPSNIETVREELRPRFNTKEHDESGDLGDPRV